MSAGTPFLNVFQKLPTDHPLADYYPFLEVIALTYQNDGETLEISAVVTRLLPSKQVLALADLIKETYPELPSKILIRPVYDLPENYTLQDIISAYWESIVEAVAKHHFAVKRIFETGEWSVEAEDRLRVSVPESVFFKTMEKEWRERIQSLLREQFHRGVLVTIEQKKVQKNIRISEEELVRRHIELNRKPAQEKDAAAEET